MITSACSTKYEQSIGLCWVFVSFSQRFVWARHRVLFHRRDLDCHILLPTNTPCGVFNCTFTFYNNIVSWRESENLCLLRETHHFGNTEILGYPKGLTQIVSMWETKLKLVWKSRTSGTENDAPEGTISFGVTAAKWSKRISCPLTVCQIQGESSVGILWDTKFVSTPDINVDNLSSFLQMVMKLFSHRPKKETHHLHFSVLDISPVNCFTLGDSCVDVPQPIVLRAESTEVLSPAIAKRYCLRNALYPGYFHRYVK